MEHSELTQKIIGCAMKVHNVLGPGFLESVYRNALAHELRKADIPLEREKRMLVHYDDIVVGDFSADLLVASCVLVEVKALRAFAAGHESQLVNYLTAIHVDVGLLINFGARRLEFKRKTRLYEQRTATAGTAGTSTARQDGQDNGRMNTG